MRLHLSEFIRKGKLGSVSLGTPRESVESIFGCAEDSSFSKQKAKIHSYADRKLQVTYLADEVVLIALYLPLARSIFLREVEIIDDLPTHVVEGASAFAAWLETEHPTERWEESVIVRFGKNRISAIFDEAGNLSSLQLS